MKIHIRQPFFSIVTAIIFGILGLFYGIGAVNGTGVVLGSTELNVSVSWALTGVMFLMAYFALVHLTD